MGESGSKAYNLAHLGLFSIFQFQFIYERRINPFA